MDIKAKILTYLKMGVLMVFSLFVSGILNQEIFLNNSPVIRPHVGTYLIARVQNLGRGAGSGGNFFASLFNKGKANDEVSQHIDQQVAQRLQSIPLKAVSKGVYAKEDDQIKYVEVHTDEMTYREYNVTIKGREYKLRIPSDRKTLSPDQVQKAVEDGR
jgi:hypothetical protein